MSVRCPLTACWAARVHVTEGRLNQVKLHPRRVMSQRPLFLFWRTNTRGCPLEHLRPWQRFSCLDATLRPPRARQRRSGARSTSVVRESSGAARCRTHHLDSAGRFAFSQCGTLTSPILPRRHDTPHNHLARANHRAHGGDHTGAQLGDRSRASRRTPDHPRWTSDSCPSATPRAVAAAVWRFGLACKPSAVSQQSSPNRGCCGASFARAHRQCGNVCDSRCGVISRSALAVAADG